jgi:hypothetical protein
VGNTVVDVAEANYGAGHLLFCGSDFKEVVRISTLSFEFVKELKKVYGNMLTTTPRALGDRE